eukprot:PhF_6_TR13930/c0_g1_i1/m.22399
MVLTRTELHWIQKNIMNDDVLVYMWWQVLCGISTVNIILWLYTALTKSFASNKDTTTKTPRIMLLLSGLFVAGCAFRSFFVKDYFRLLVLREHPLSSVFAGRSIAMVAEVSFAAQFAILLYNYGRQAGVRWITAFAKYWVVPALFTAQWCCWYSIVSHNFLGSTIEESLWTVTFAITGVALLQLTVRTGRLFLLAFVVAIGVYVAFMVTVDVPMYYTRWQASDSASYKSLYDGLMDSIYKYRVSAKIEDWVEEMPWMTGYFSGAVWLSLLLCHVPWDLKIRQKDKKKTN